MLRKRVVDFLIAPFFFRILNQPSHICENA